MIDVDYAKAMTYETVAALHAVRDELGAGLNEAVYQEGLEMQLREMEIPYEREKAVHPMYHGQQMEAEFRLDFLCEEQVIVECKAVSRLCKDHCAQLFNYLHLTQYPIGILVNFQPAYMEIERYIYDAEADCVYGFDGNPVSDFHQRIKRNK